MGSLRVYRDGSDMNIGRWTCVGRSAHCRFQRLNSAHGQHWLIGDLMPYTQALVSSATGSAGPPGGGGGLAPTSVGGSVVMNTGSPTAGGAAHGVGAIAPGILQPRTPLVRLVEQAAQVMAHVRAGNVLPLAARWRAYTEACTPLAAALAALLTAGSSGGTVRGSPATAAVTAAVASSPGSPSDGAVGAEGSDYTERLRTAARNSGRAVAALCDTCTAGGAEYDSLLLPVAGIVYAWIRACCLTVAPAAAGRTTLVITIRGSPANSQPGSPVGGGIGRGGGARLPVGPRATASVWGVANSGLMLSIEALRMELCSSLGGVVSEQRLQRALLAVSCAALCDPAAAAADAAAAFPEVGAARVCSAAGSPPWPRPHTTSATSTATAATAAAAQEAVHRLVLSAVVYGQLLLADAVSLLCNDCSSSSPTGGPASSMSWDVMACRRALLGPPPGLPGCYCRAEAAIRSWIQAALPLDLVWNCLSDVLPRAMVASPATAPTGPPSPLDVDAVAVNLAAVLVSYPPLRHCLLSDPRALHERLCAPAAVQATATLLNAMADITPIAASVAATTAGSESALRLPQRLVVLSLASGQLTTAAMVAAHEAVSGLEADTLLAAALLPLDPSCFPMLWLLLRLLVDEQAMMMAVVGSRIAGGGAGGTAPAESLRRGLREAVEVAVAPPTPAEGKSWNRKERGLYQGGI